MSAQATGASRTMGTARKVENACRSRRLAGTRSMPAGQRSRTAASAAVLLELEAGDEADDIVSLLLLVQPVLVGAVADRLLLGIVEIARIRLLDDLVPGRRGEPVVLLTHLAGVKSEELLLRRKVGDHPARDPAHVTAVVLGGGVLGVLLRDRGEVGAGIEGSADVGDLLARIGECLEIAAHGTGRRDLDLRDVYLRDRGHHGGLLTFGEQVAKQVVLAVPLDVGFGEFAGAPSFHD